MFDSDKINQKFESEIELYRVRPTLPCTKQEAIKLLKKFDRTDFNKFWTESIGQFLPAVSTGVMKITGHFLPHDEAFKYAKQLAVKFERNSLAQAYLYGIASGKPEYCTALASYYYILNLPDHKFVKKYIGNNGKDIYSDETCEICAYHSVPSPEPKMRFWHINVSMSWFYLYARMSFRFNLNEAILYLEEFQKLSAPCCSKDDYRFFLEVISVIENLPKGITPYKLRENLKSSCLLKMTNEQLNDFIDMLGYLNILHTPDCFGVTKEHICEKDMKLPLSDRSYNAYPVHRWKSDYGVDRDAVEALFGDCY